MQWHDFIFSDQRRHRLARHIAFWLVWSLAYNILFHLPTHLFKGWGPPNNNFGLLQQLGLPLLFIRTLIVNSFLANSPLHPVQILREHIFETP